MIGNSKIVIAFIGILFLECSIADPAVNRIKRLSLNLNAFFCATPLPMTLAQIEPMFSVYTKTASTSFNVSDEGTAAESVSELVDQGFLALNRQVVFIVHGFLGNAKTDWMEDVKTELLKVEDATVFVISWTNGAQVIDYGLAKSNTQIVSGAVAAVGRAVLNSKTFNGNTDNLYLYCIGHSLGAHICGQAGHKATVNNAPFFDRITGLDPAGPGFETCGWDDNIEADSARCVDNIHTDGTTKGHILPMHFGTVNQWGHVDFYPNGGSNQPGCSIFNQDVGCSHGKSHEYFEYTIGNPNTCQASGTCSNSSDIPASCGSSTKQLMGYYSSCHYKSAQVVPGAFYATVSWNTAKFC